MTNRETLLALADRVEAMDGPDRAVDAEIAQAIGMCLHPNQTRNGAQSDWGYDCDDCGANSWGSRSRDGFNRRLSDPNPRFTSSLDAAMTLCPDGFCVWAMGQIPDDCCFYAELWRDGSTKSEGEIRSSSLAQALVAACLRAQAGGE